MATILARMTTLVFCRFQHKVEWSYNLKLLSEMALHFSLEGNSQDLVKKPHIIYDKRDEERYEK
jgi:hypothetical protein